LLSENRKVLVPAWKYEASFEEKLAFPNSEIAVREFPFRKTKPLSSALAAPLMEAFVKPAGSVKGTSKKPLSPSPGGMFITTELTGAPGGTEVKVPKLPTKAGPKTRPEVSPEVRTGEFTGTPAANVLPSLTIVMLSAIAEAQPASKAPQIITTEEIFILPFLIKCVFKNYCPIEPAVFSATP
jgi:hypothetical protein